MNGGSRMITAPFVRKFKECIEAPEGYYKVLKGGDKHDLQMDNDPAKYRGTWWNQL